MRNHLKTDPEKPASEMTLRERFAMEFAKARIGNPGMFEKHGGNAIGIGQDAVMWADHVIMGLNGELPTAQPPTPPPPLKSVPGGAN